MVSSHERQLLLIADVTTSLTTLILEMISSRSNLLDSFVILYATFVGALHRIIGIEFGEFARRP